MENLPCHGMIAGAESVVWHTTAYTHAIVRAFVSIFIIPVWVIRLCGDVGTFRRPP